MSIRKLPIKRWQISLPDPLAAECVALAQERGIEFAELIRTGMFEYITRQRKLIPRQGRQRAQPATQARMRLEERT